MASLAILEEHILTLGNGQESLNMVGWEGIFGIAITLAFLAVAQLIPCPLDDVTCVNGNVDDVFLFLD